MMSAKPMKTMEPFTIAIPASVLDDLHQRLDRTRWPNDSGDADSWQDGANPAYLRALVEYWRDAFDWRAQEARLNRFAHFHATVDGTRVHFIHERGRGPAAYAMIQGTIVEAAKDWAGTNVPAGFAMFPKDLSHPPREWAERFFDVQRWTEMPRGGHFGALEEPELLAAEIREFFRRLR
jgi:pimeloyl-ACP methyl ester carboxylesterase